jgi:Ca2+-dependent lipid-binding protein
MDICVQNDCESAYSREWVITIEGGTVSERNSEGNTWDAFGGSPDPFVILDVDGEQCTTRSKENTLTPVWNQECTFTIFSDSTWTIRVFDEDLENDDLIDRVAERTIPMSTLRDGETSFSRAGEPALVTLSLRHR